MRFIPIISAFVVALIGGIAVGLRPGYPFGSILIGAAIVAAMTGLASSVLQFVSNRFYLLAATIVGVALGLLVPPMLGMAEVIGFGDVRGAASVVWPVAVVVGLVLSHEAGMQLPRLRRWRPRLNQRP